MGKGKHPKCTLATTQTWSGISSLYPPSMSRLPFLVFTCQNESVGDWQTQKGFLRFVLTGGNRLSLWIWELTVMECLSTSLAHSAGRFFKESRAADGIISFYSTALSLPTPVFLSCTQSHGDIRWSRTGGGERRDIITQTKQHIHSPPLSFLRRSLVICSATCVHLMLIMVPLSEGTWTIHSIFVAVEFLTLPQQCECSGGHNTSLHTASNSSRTNRAWFELQTHALPNSRVAWGNWGCCVSDMMPDPYDIMEIEPQILLNCYYKI